MPNESAGALIFGAAFMPVAASPFVMMLTVGLEPLWLTAAAAIVLFIYVVLYVRIFRKYKRSVK